MVQQVGCVVGLPVRWVAIPYVIGCGRFDAVGCKRIMVGMGLSANKAATGARRSTTKKLPQTSNSLSVLVEQKRQPPAIPTIWYILCRTSETLLLWSSLKLCTIT